MPRPKSSLSPADQSRERQARFQAKRRSLSPLERLLFAKGERGLVPSLVYGPEERAALAEIQAEVSQIQERAAALSDRLLGRLDAIPDPVARDAFATFLRDGFTRIQIRNF